MLYSVDAHAIGCHLTGNEVYIRNLLEQFSRLDQDSEFLTFASQSDAFNLIPKRFRQARVSGNPFVRLGLDIPLLLRRHRPALIHVQYTAPWNCATPIITTVHDVSYIEHPEFFTSFRAKQLRLTVAHTVKKAVRILTPSEFSKREILRLYDVPEERVVVLPNGVSPEFRPLPRERALGWVRGKYKVPAKYVLTVGDLQPRKNHVRLIEAFSSLMREHPKLTHHLVIAGKAAPWYEPEVRKAVKNSGFESRIHLLGWVPDGDMAQLYAGCDVFAFPSLYEGFGIPILEAMASGRSVACSKTTAMPEVADGAGVLFDPKSTDDMARALRDLLLDPELRHRMERLGQQWASQFSWARTAEKTLEVYRDVAGVRQHRMQPAHVAARA